MAKMGGDDSYGRTHDTFHMDAPTTRSIAALHAGGLEQTAGHKRVTLCNSSAASDRLKRVTEPRRECGSQPAAW
jgi:hypothetical protein